MTDIDIEKEVQARVEFKLSELLTGVKNRVAIKYRQAFDMTQRSQYAWQAFEELEQMLKKEVMMATPHDDMDKKRKWHAKNKAVTKILDAVRHSMRGYGSDRLDHLTREVVSAVEEAQV